MMRRTPYVQEELPVEDLLAFGRLKDESRDPRAIHAWASFEQHGDKRQLNADIQEVIRQSRETGPMPPAASPAAAQSEQGKYSTTLKSSHQLCSHSCYFFSSDLCRIHQVRLLS